MSPQRHLLVQALALTVTTMVAAAEATRHHREIDGFVPMVHSGAYGIVGRLLRESPMRYWVAYAGLVGGAMLCLLVNLFHGPQVALGLPVGAGLECPSTPLDLDIPRPVDLDPPSKDFDAMFSVSTKQLQEPMRYQRLDVALGVLTEKLHASMLTLLSVIGCPTEKLHGAVLPLQSCILGSSFVFVAVVLSAVCGGGTVSCLADLTVTYLVGLCITQIMIDTVRVSTVEHPYLQLVPFAAASVFTVFLLNDEGFRSLDRLNSAYMVANAPIFFFAGRYTYVKRIAVMKGVSMKVVAGALTSTAHIGFCCAAAYIAWQVEGVQGAVILAFFYTTVLMTGIIHVYNFFWLLVIWIRKKVKASSPSHHLVAGLYGTMGPFWGCYFRVN